MMRKPSINRNSPRVGERVLVPRPLAFQRNVVGTYMGPSMQSKKGVLILLEPHAIDLIYLGEPSSLVLVVGG